MTRPTSHEAGHAVVGLYFDFRIDVIEVFEGRLRTICDLDSEERLDSERFVFLAGGIAGEQQQLGQYDSAGCADDQLKISQRGGEAIGVYLPRASEIVLRNRQSFDSLRRKIATTIMAKQMTMSIAGGKNSFSVLSSQEIHLIWNQTR